MRNTITTSFTGRTQVSTTLTSRLRIAYLMTEALDFLMTEDDKHIILEKSVFNTFTGRTPIITNFT